jgi:integrase
MPYTLQELSESLGIPVGTLRDWVGFGLPHRQDRAGAKRIWIKGTDLADWITAIRQERRKFGVPLGDDEAYCMKCRMRVELEGPYRDRIDGKRLDRAGRCNQCGAQVHRSFAHRDGQAVIVSAPPMAPALRQVQAHRRVSRENYLLVQSFQKQLLSFGYAEKTHSRYASYLRHLLLWAGETPLFSAHTLKPDLFEYMDTGRQDGSGAALADQTRKKVVRVAHEFFIWLKNEHQKPARSMPMAWIHRIRSPRSRSRRSSHGQASQMAIGATPSAAPERDAVTEAEILTVARLTIPANEVTLLRDQAAACFLFASGIRAGAFCTLPVRAFDPKELTVAQLAELGVLTKNGKRAVTSLLPIPELIKVIQHWDHYVRSRLPVSAMWFTPFRGNWGQMQLTADPAGPSRQHQLPKALWRIYSHAGLPYRHPHAHRHGHAMFALQHARSLADYKAISQNLMHGDLFITDRTYAVFNSDDVHERIQGLLKPAGATTSDGIGPTAIAPGGDLANAQLMAQIDRMLEEKFNRHMGLGGRA